MKRLSNYPTLPSKKRRIENNEDNFLNRTKNLYKINDEIEKLMKEMINSFRTNDKNFYFVINTNDSEYVKFFIERTLEFLDDRMTHKNNFLHKYEKRYFIESESDLEKIITFGECEKGEIFKNNTLEKIYYSFNKRSSNFEKKDFYATKENVLKKKPREKKKLFMFYCLENDTNMLSGIYPCIKGKNRFFNITIDNIPNYDRFNQKNVLDLIKKKYLRKLLILCSDRKSIWYYENMLRNPMDKISHLDGKKISEIRISFINQEKIILSIVKYIQNIYKELKIPNIYANFYTIKDFGLIYKKIIQSTLIDLFKNKVLGICENTHLDTFNFAKIYHHSGVIFNSDTLKITINVEKSSTKKQLEREVGDIYNLFLEEYDMKLMFSLDHSITYNMPK